jgi:carboxypeptidase family protein
MPLRRLLAALWLLSTSVAFCDEPEKPVQLEVTVRDPGNLPAAGINIQVRQGAETVALADTDSQGHAAFARLKPGHYEVTAAPEGFERLSQGVDLRAGGTASVDWQMVPALSRKESIDVKAAPSPVEQSASSSTSVSGQLARQLPGRPATVADALPLIPGVARSPGGGLQISGSGEHRSALLVNSADVTDPATGDFGLTVPIDSVDTLTVYQTPFLAEYGRFTAGLVSVETRRGSDQWKWELNDPFPDFRIRSYHMRGLADATPRLNFEGPLLPGRLYFSEGFEYAVRKTEVYTLPFPNDQTKQEDVNSFAQLDWVMSDRQLATATVHVAPQRLEYVNINYFNPEVTSPDASTHNYTVTLGDHYTLGGGVLENTISATRFDAGVWGQGNADFVMTPLGNSGNYFAQQSRTASRMSWSPIYSFAKVTWAGSHDFKIGSSMGRSSDDGRINEHPVDILNAAGRLTERIAFTGGQPYSMSDTEFAFFGEDHWILTPRLALDLGLRTESQAVSESFRVAPRGGIAWTPFATRGTVVRAGFGLFYDRVPLNVYSFASYPNRIVTLFDASGQVAGGPYFYQNTLGEVVLHDPFVRQEPVAGNFSPRSSTWSAQVEQPLTPMVKLRVGYMQNDSAGLVLLNPVSPDPVSNLGASMLTGNGQSRYRQFEITARVRVSEKSPLYFSYVHSRACGDLNEFGNFLGSFQAPLIRPDQFANLPTDLPNRFLTWGVVQLPQGFRIAPVLEYRSGFPFLATDAVQNYAGVPYQNRFPNFFSVDSRFSKDIKVNPKYTVRLSVSGFNLSDHFNPEALHTNIADPAYGFLFGQRGRRFTADFDVLF